MSIDPDLTKHVIRNEGCDIFGTAVAKKKNIKVLRRLVAMLPYETIELILEYILKGESPLPDFLSLI